MKTRTETDRIKELEAEVKRLRMALADEVLDNKIDEAALRLMCRRAGTTPEGVKKEWWGIAHDMSEENEGIPVTRLCDRFGKSTVAYYKNRKAREQGGLHPSACEAGAHGQPDGVQRDIYVVPNVAA